jgi:serpin B
MRMKTIAIFLLGSILLTHCQRDRPAHTRTPVPELGPQEKTLVQSNNTFGLKLFREMTEKKRGNVFISPLSTAMALAIAYNGADGATQEAIRRTLQLDDLSLEDVNRSCSSLGELLPELDPKVSCLIANSVWYRLGFPVETDFVDLAGRIFSARVSGLDFSQSTAPDTINRWVAQSTRGEITEIVDDLIDPDVVMFLINAFHFKGVWAYQFDEQKTKDDWFFLTVASRKPCEMMEQRGEYLYFSNQELQAVDLPYGGGAFSMTIFLPRPGQQIDSLIAQFGEERWNIWINGLSADSGDIFLPKFTLEYEDTLNDPLTALGMGVAFTPSADFTKICTSEEIWIDEVKHKIFLKVNEEGTEAAAAASVVLGKGPRPSGFRFVVNRPFVLVIREHHSQAILLIGRVVDLPPPQG